MNRRILMVDDEPFILEAYARNLADKFEVETATTPAAALALLNSSVPFATIISDLRMPGMNGVEFLRECKTHYSDMVRVLISGNADLESAINAVNEGSIFRILTKPCPQVILCAALEDALRQYQLITAERELLDQTLNGSIQVMVDILSMIDPEAFGRATFRREASKIVAQALGLANTWDIEIAALLSDIGRVTIPPEITKKQQAGETLSNSEKDIWSKLPEISAKLVANIPRMEEVSEIVHYRNKNYDGTGFPADALSKEEIPIGARILRVVDGFLSSKQNALSLHWLDSNNNLYDPSVVEAVRQSIDNIKAHSFFAPVTASIRKVTLKELHSGQKLCSDVRTLDNVLVMAAGLVLQPVHIEKIHNFDHLSGIKQPIEVM